MPGIDHQRGAQGGFTLVELLAGISIAIAMTLILLGSVRSIGSNYLVGSAASEVAATIRQARVLAIREGQRAGVSFSVVNNSLTLFLDNPNGGTPQRLDETDTIVVSKQLPRGIAFGYKEGIKKATQSSSSEITDPITLNSDTVSYNSRGIADTGNDRFIYLVSQELLDLYPGDTPPMRAIRVSRAGSVHIYELDRNTTNVWH